VAVGVAGSKNITQFVATVFASPVRPAGMFESTELEAAADAEAEALADEAGALAGAAADVVAAGGAEVVELDELHAASARQLTVAATARNGLKGRVFTGAGLLKIEKGVDSTWESTMFDVICGLRRPVSGTASH
jgi:hypothetical protein